MTLAEFKTIRLKPRDLILIINACALTGVKHLKFGELELKFLTGDAEKLRLDPDPVEPPIEQELKTVGLRVEHDSKIDQLEDDLATLQIDDPARFEELIVQQELDFSGSPSEEEAVND